MEFDRAAWLADPKPFVEGALGDGGHYLALGVAHVVSPEQIAYACDVARTLTRSVARPGIVSMPEAETGTGKTRAYLTAALLHSAATGGRVLIATYRIDLRSTIVDREAPHALAVVERMTGRRLVVAPLMARTHFASPSRAEAFADRLAADDDRQTAVFALRSIAKWTRASAQEFRTSPVAAVGRIAGTIDAWRREHPELIDALPLDDLDQWGLDARCPQEEHLAYETYRAAAHDADCLVLTQAALVIGLRIRDGFGAERPIVGVVVDEADRLEDAARNVLERRGSIADLDRSRLAMHEAIARNDLPLDPATRLRLADLALDLGETLRPLHAFCAEAREARRQSVSRPLDQVPVKGDEPWLAQLSASAKAATKAAAALRATRIPALVSVADDVAARAGIHANFVASATDSDKALGRTFLTFSPILGFPSVLVAAKYGSRIVQRLWNAPGQGEDAPAITPATVFTSATLSQPGLRGAERLADMSHMVGLDWTPGRLQEDLSGQHAPRRYGTVERFVLAHPSAPMPVRRTGEDEDAEPELDENEFAVHRAFCVVEAADRPPVAGRRRVLVVTTSWHDTDVIVAALPERLSNRLIVRRRGQSLSEVLARFREVEDAILITPGAGEGFDPAGLVGRLLIPRLPFSPPEDAFGLPLVWNTENGPRASSDVVRMMRRFKQAIGRAIRTADDVAEIWILDPRFGLPASVQRREMLVPARNARNLYQHCVPARFRAVLEQAEIFVPETAVAPRRRRAAGGRR
jgi:ATP-dependent DNA helicase DinG